MLDEQVPIIDLVWPLSIGRFLKTTNILQNKEPKCQKILITESDSVYPTLQFYLDASILFKVEDDTRRIPIIKY